MPLDDILKKGCWLTPSVFKSHHATIVGHYSSDLYEGQAIPPTVIPSSTSRGTLHNANDSRKELPPPMQSHINNLPSSSSQVKEFVKHQETTDSQHPGDTEVPPTAPPLSSCAPPMLETLAAVDLDFEMPLSHLAPGLTASDFDNTDSIVSSLFDKADNAEPDIQVISETVGAPLDNTPQDLVDEHLHRALQNINNLVLAMSHLLRSLPLPSVVPVEPLSPPPQFQDISVLPPPPPPPTAPDPVLPAVNLLDEAMQPLFTIPPAPSSNLKAICDQILMPPPPALKKWGSVQVIPST